MHLWYIVQCTWRHYLNSQSVFIWCELDYSCQPKTWCCWGPLKKTPPPKLVNHQQKCSSNNNTATSNSEDFFISVNLWRWRWYRAIGWGLGPKRTFSSLSTIGHRTLDRVIFLQEVPGFLRPVSRPHHHTQTISSLSIHLKLITWVENYNLEDLYCVWIAHTHITPVKLCGDWHGAGWCIRHVSELDAWQGGTAQHVTEEPGSWCGQRSMSFEPSHHPVCQHFHKYV